MKQEKIILIGGRGAGKSAAAKQSMPVLQAADDPNVNSLQWKTHPGFKKRPRFLKFKNSNYGLK